MEQRGFSFIEILVALLLIISISLALFKQQWQINRLRIQMQQTLRIWLQQSNERERGFTILECLIGLGLALSLMTLLMQQYVQIKQQSIQTAQTRITLSRVQSVIHGWKRSGHQAGFTPCLPISQLQSLNPRTGQSLQAMVFHPSPSFKLTLSRMSTQFVPVFVSRGAHELIWSDSWAPHVGRPLIIADCQHAEILETYQVQAHTLRMGHALKFTYHFPIYLGEWLTESWWLKSNSRRQMALFYQYGATVAELLNGVKHFDGHLSLSHPHPLLHLELGLETEKPFAVVVSMYHL